MRRFLAFFLILLCLFTGCAQNSPTAAEKETTATADTPLPDADSYGLSVAVLHDDSVYWEDTRDLLNQSVLIGMTVEAVDVNNGYDLRGYDLVIPDAQLAQSDAMEQLSEDLVLFTENGGYVLLDNAFAQVLPEEYLGISGSEKLTSCPLDLTYPALGDDLAKIQEVIEDYTTLYPQFHEAETLLQQDYGFSFTVSTALPLARMDGQAVYTYNAYGAGGVMLTNPVLPNVYSIGNYAMALRTGDETAFAATTASCNQLLYSRFAGYVAKQLYGYAVNRVYGYNGSPSMAWELHYEEITAYANNSMKIFDEICRGYQQIPSYTIIRSSYWWFLRTETVTYLHNQSTDGGYEFQMDYEESAYSSGTHIESDGEWLHQESIENAGSYFREYPEYNYRAYPCFGDADGDGDTELVSGSEDGYFYVYDDLQYTDRLHVSAAHRLTDTQGLALQVTGFSAPQLYDVDADGITDLISGCEDGMIYWFRGLGDGNFERAQVLLQTDIPGQSLPALGDLDGDGVEDLAVGSDQGILLVYYGEKTNGRLSFSWHRMDSYSKICQNAELGDWLAPGYCNGDLIVGTFNGYLAILSGREFQGYLDIDEMNYMGNFHVKFGNYCVPCFWDLDGDGADDLVCGSLEYGLAYPIDSEYFPYRAELQEQFDYAKRNYQYIGIHHYTNGYASAAREAYELQRHKEAFESYGAASEGVGANIHTWYMSAQGDTQTLDQEYQAGLLWNSGFAAPYDVGVAPQYAAENVIALPFFLREKGEDTLLVQNCSVLPYADDSWTVISARYAMPMCVYYHCDFVYENDAGARDYIQKLSDFQHTYGYNFVREDQLMKASAAALNLQVQIQQEGDSLILTPSAKSMDGSLYDADAQSAAGIEIDFAEDRDASQYQTNAKVWHRDGNSLYLRLGETVCISRSESESPLRQVNLPAEIQILENGAQICFLDDGMMQVITPKGYTADTSCVGWTVTEQGDSLVFTKYGSADTLQIRKTREG